LNVWQRGRALPWPDSRRRLSPHQLYPSEDFNDL